MSPTDTITLYLQKFFNIDLRADVGARHYEMRI